MLFLATPANTLSIFVIPVSVERVREFNNCKKKRSVMIICWG